MYRICCYLVFTLIIQIITGCYKIEEIQALEPPIAKFSIQNDNCLADCSISFNNLSTNASRFYGILGMAVSRIQIKIQVIFTNDRAHILYS